MEVAVDAMGSTKRWLLLLGRSPSHKTGFLLKMKWAIPENNSIPYHGRLLGFPKGRGGSRLWNSEGMGGLLRVF